MGADFFKLLRVFLMDINNDDGGNKFHKNRFCFTYNMTTNTLKK